VEMAETIAPGCELLDIGIRPGEKLHEVLISEDEARHTVETDGMYVIKPAHPWWRREHWKHARPLPEGFRYASDSNSQWLTSNGLLELVGESTLVNSNLRGFEVNCARA
jgi:UDP-N-acetylglucosamine 4,6-dehydratase/5-epimerase